MADGGPAQFQARGVAFLGALAAAERAPGGLDGVRARMPQKERDRLEPIYVAQSYYPLETLVALMRAVAESEGLDFSRFVVQAATRAAKQDVTGLYKQALRSATPGRMAERLPRIFNRYFDPSQATLVARDERSMEVVVAPVPLERVEFFRSINEGFVAGALETAGARGILFTWGPEVREAEALASLQFTARWQLT